MVHRPTVLGLLGWLCWIKSQTGSFPSSVWVSGVSLLHDTTKKKDTSPSIQWSRVDGKWKSVGSPASRWPNLLMLWHTKQPKKKEKQVAPWWGSRLKFRDSNAWNLDQSSTAPVYTERAIAAPAREGSTTATTCNQWKASWRRPTLPNQKKLCSSKQ